MNIFKKTMERLQKSKEELDVAKAGQETASEKGEELTEDQKLEKAFDDKMAALTDQGEGNGDDKPKEDDSAKLEKAKKEDKKKDDDDEDDEDDKKKGEGEQQSLFKKSFETETPGEVVEVMNVEPFLKSVVEALDKQFSALTKSIEGNATAIGENQEVQARMTEFMVSQGQLVKSNFQKLTSIGGQPVPRQARLTVRDRFQASASESLAKSATEYDPTQVRQAMLEAGAKGLLKSFQIAKCESRISKGQPIPNEVLTAMESLQKAKGDQE